MAVAPEIRCQVTQRASGPSRDPPTRQLANNSCGSAIGACASRAALFLFPSQQTSSSSRTAWWVIRSCPEQGRAGQDTEASKLQFLPAPFHHGARTACHLPSNPPISLIARHGRTNRWLSLQFRCGIPSRADARPGCLVCVESQSQPGLAGKHAQPRAASSVSEGCDLRGEKRKGATLYFVLTGEPQQHDVRDSGGGHGCPRMPNHPSGWARQTGSGNLMHSPPREVLIHTSRAPSRATATRGAERCIFFLPPNPPPSGWNVE